MRTLAPPDLRDRFDVYRFFNGLSVEAKEGLEQLRARVPLVKTFLLEHVGRRGNGHPRPPVDIFRELGAEIRLLDKCFMGLRFQVLDPESNRDTLETTGFLEQFDERFFAYYTCEKAAEAQKRVARWIQAPDLDYAWFSSPLLQVLWDQDLCKRGDQRFGKLVCPGLPLQPAMTACNGIAHCNRPDAPTEPWRSAG